MTDPAHSGRAWQAELASLLRDQGAIAVALRDTLLNEHAALRDHDRHDFGQIVAEKDVLLHQLEAAETLRARCLTGAGLDAGETAAWLPPRDADKHELGVLWRTLLGNISECQRLNAVNGRLIAHQREFVQSALAVLRGQPVQQPVYAADGRPTPGRGGRRLGTV